MSKKSLPTIALIVVSILWGANVVFIKISTDSMPVPIFVASRFLIAGLILLPFAIRLWKPLRKRDLLLLVTSSLMYVSVSTVALNTGITLTTAINASIIGLLSPIVLLLFSALFLKEKINNQTFIGVCIAFAGGLVIIGTPWHIDQPNLKEIFGNLLVFGSVLCHVISTIIIKPLSKRISPYQLAVMNFVPGAIPVAIFSLSYISVWEISTVPPEHWMAFTASTVVMVISNPLFFYALKHKPANETSVYKYINPIATMVVAYFLLAETPSLKFAIGAILICVGLYIAEFYQKNKLASKK